MKRLLLLLVCTTLCAHQSFAGEEKPHTKTHQETESDPITRLRSAYAQRNRTRVEMVDEEDTSTTKKKPSAKLKLLKEFMRNSLYCGATYYFWAYVQDQEINHKKIIIKSALSGAGISILPIVLDTTLNFIF